MEKVGTLETVVLKNIKVLLREKLKNTSVLHISFPVEKRILITRIYRKAYKAINWITIERNEYPLLMICPEALARSYLVFYSPLVCSTQKFLSDNNLFKRIFHDKNEIR